jgi:hypothetical protein
MAGKFGGLRQAVLEVSGFWPALARTEWPPVAIRESGFARFLKSLRGRRHGRGELSAYLSYPLTESTS